jgi:hypothetical protein
VRGRPPIARPRCDTALDWLSGKFTSLGDTIKTVWNDVWRAVKPPIEWIIGKVQSLVDQIDKLGGS